MHTHHHGDPMIELNETEITMWHGPTLPSYWSIDVEDRDPDVPRYPGLMVLHVLCMSLAFFVALPAGIAMRSMKHAWHGLPVLGYYCFCVLGCAASGLYRKLTPDMYEGSSHATHGYLVLLSSLGLSAVDICGFALRIYSYMKSSSKFAFYPFWRNVVLGHSEDSTSSSVYISLIAEEPEDYDEVVMKPGRLSDKQESPHVSQQPSIAPIQIQDELEDQTSPWVSGHAHHYSTSSERTIFEPTSPHGSRHSEETLHDVAILPTASPKVSLGRRVARAAFGTFERALVSAGFAMTLTGIVVYTGGCRGGYVNGCLAHLIKGGIFWCYGLVTFARFLGSFSELGWAWNIAPAGEYVSAEFVESLVIFLYGITNTWMERFGTQPGDPYTTKQVQHISIAVMFWFAGIVGMGIESKRVRGWLASTAAASAGPSASLITEPPTYRASFNPFPALVIGVTGVAMSAHAQTYLFQVQIHQLWGFLLLGFSVLRCLTYFFVWLGPPRSILPSRPPTEALGSFFLACGGLVFIFSTEEVTTAAMRKGRDDMMMFLNLAVAITCFAFTWTLCLVAFKGWLKARTTTRIAHKLHHSSSP
ncbi:hypothetical protein BJ138DRAFT_996237 [Hygrophoropsis aurantiaca]|uniref:Uncharacterized protein n=1 Tax=Hygrophoropsis aurantiaca TaxID=72124 RepID=A0ACB8AT28_9AGAM|nr:hypothetical protein BJ138DRAFT_996237 [Hygrophoropsis aurantiaca]